MYNQTRTKQRVEPQEERKGPEFNEENFPRLGEVPTKTNVWGGTKTFAELATECAKKAESEKIFKQVKEVEKQKKETTRRSNVQLPHFNNIHRYVEPEDEEEKPVQQKEEDEWIEVNHKKRRRQKSFEEIVNRPPTPEEGDTVWDADAQEEHETCWDERRP